MLSLVSVVFDFSALLNDVVPVSPMWFSVDVKRKKKKLFVDGHLWCVVFVFTTQIECNECRV